MKINTQGTFKLHKDYPESRIVFEKENIFPLFPHFCPVCGIINVFSKHCATAIDEYGMCGKCNVWWEGEKTISSDKDIIYKLEKFIKYIDKYGNCKLEIDFENLTYESIIKEK